MRSASLSNGLVTLSFDEATGWLTSFTAAGHELLTEPASPLWQLRLRDDTPYQLQQPIKMEFRQTGKDAMDIRWQAADGLCVTAHIRLTDDSPLAHWSLSLSSRDALEIKEIHYPILSGIRRLSAPTSSVHENLAVSTWLGSLIHSPRSGVNSERPRISYSWDSPGLLSMQMIALYDSKEGNGLYFASNDTLSHAKTFEIGFEAQTTDWRMRHYLPMKQAGEYRMPYEAIVGPFHGDWLSAAAIYREWASQQRWCRESRFARRLTPRWAMDTELWIWNRGHSTNVLREALDLKRRTGCKVNVFWHWWHGCSYDEGFPEYLPPREGRQSFVKAVRQARHKGIHSLVYMNSYQWGNSTDSWIRDGAERFAARRMDGGLYSHAFNAFTGRELTPMCMATDFWRSRYASLADSVVNSYGVAGVYMDQACMNLRCFSDAHGHPAGGGNYWLTSFLKLTDEIRRCTPATLAGEGSGEDWIPSLDLFLTLEASRERYLGITNIETIPLYQAVYHDFAITYGSYSSLVYPPYDTLWPAQFRPQNCEKSLPDDFNMQFRMEQARAFVWGMQPTLANYHAFLWEEKPGEMDFLMRIVNVRRRALKYLLHGVFTRVPPLEIPQKEIPLSRISIYAGRNGSTVTATSLAEPMVYAGAWRTEDGAVAMAVANIDDVEWKQRLHFSGKEYNVPTPCRIYLVSANGRRRVKVCRDDMVDVELSLAPRDVQVVEFVPMQ